MKKKCSNLLAVAMPLIVFCGITTATPSCVSSSDDTAEFRTDSISCSDSLATNSAGAFCSITVDYPVEGPAALVDSIRMWIADRLASNGYTYPGDPKPYATATTDIADGRKLIKSVCSAALADAANDFATLDSIHSLSPDFTLHYEYYWDIRKLHETESYVTYTANTYSYLGGAHGSNFAFSQTFDAATGAELGYEIFNHDSLPAIKSMMKNELVKYFSVTNTDELRDALLIDPDTLPLPATPPTLMEDGVHFLYQQYEIAPYAAGMPNGVLPYDKLAGCLTTATKALLDTSTEQQAE